MTPTQRMDRPISITLQSADWDMIQGLITGERNKVRDEGRTYPNMARPQFFEDVGKNQVTFNTIQSLIS